MKYICTEHMEFWTLFLYELLYVCMNILLYVRMYVLLQTDCHGDGDTDSNGDIDNRSQGITYVHKQLCKVDFKPACNFA